MDGDDDPSAGEATEDEVVEAEPGALSAAKRGLQYYGPPAPPQPNWGSVPPAPPQPYFTLTTPVSNKWNATTACVAQGGRLAAIESATAQADALQTVQAALGNSGWVYMAGRRRGVKYTAWEWEHSGKVFYHLNSKGVERVNKYHNFGLYYPLGNRNDAYRCILMDKKDGYWGDWPCGSMTAPVLCENVPPPPSPPPSLPPSPPQPPLRQA